MKKKYRGMNGTIGFIYSWDSAVKNVGTGNRK